MLVNRTYFIITTFLMMIVLSILLKDVITAGIITWVVSVAGYIIIGYIRNKKRLRLLEEMCDPQAFIEATERQRKITGKDRKINACLDVDRSAGLILMGKFQEAKEVLLSINKSYLSNINGILLAYTINLMSCLYELGEIDEAEALFETQVPLLSPVNRPLRLAMKSLAADRLFFLNRYEESGEKFRQLLREKISKRVRLGILYRLAQIDQKAGDMRSAEKKFKEVADNGNQLWIAAQAQKQ